MTTVNPLQTLVFVRLRCSSTALSEFTVSQPRFVSAHPEAHHD